MRNDKAYNEYKRTGLTYSTRMILENSSNYNIPEYNTDKITNEKEVSSLLICDIIGHFPKNELVKLNGKNVVLKHEGKIVKIKEVK